MTLSAKQRTIIAVAVLLIAIFLGLETHKTYFPNKTIRYVLSFYGNKIAWDKTVPNLDALKEHLRKYNLGEVPKYYYRNIGILARLGLYKYYLILIAFLTGLALFIAEDKKNIITPGIKRIIAKEGRLLLKIFISIVVFLLVAIIVGKISYHLSGISNEIAIAICQAGFMLASAVTKIYLISIPIRIIIWTVRGSYPGD